MAMLLIRPEVVGRGRNVSARSPSIGLSELRGAWLQLRAERAEFPFMVAARALQGTRGNLLVGTRLVEIQMKLCIDAGFLLM